MADAIQQRQIPAGPDTSTATDIHEQMAQMGQWLNSISPYFPLLCEMELCRAVDGYLLYIAELLSLIYEKHPNTLKSDDKITFQFVLQHQTMEELIRALVEHRVHQLAYKGMRELNAYIVKGLGLELYGMDEQMDNAIRIIETRNLLVHNGGVVNGIFKQRLPNSPATVGERITVHAQEVALDIATLAGLATVIDERAVAKFSLPTIPLVSEPRQTGNAGGSVPIVQPVASPGADVKDNA